MKKLVLMALICLQASAYNVDKFEYELKDTLSNIKEVLSSNAANKSQRLYEILKPHLDVELMPRLVLGKENFSKAPKEFSELFFNYLQKDLAAKIDLLDAKVMELKSASIAGSRCKAEAIVGYEDAKKQLEFLFRKVGNECKLYDMQMLDTSFIASYRAQFIDIINQSGMNSLISKLSK